MQRPRIPTVWSYKLVKLVNISYFFATANVQFVPTSTILILLISRISVSKKKMPLQASGNNKLKKMTNATNQSHCDRVLIPIIRT